ncbi:hypothetical protein H9639_12955 [Arthrobacter sp. Sa2CUA1]|uniref:Uncharacterized protein n=1 Tax=Arthrobacter gallicola TaxID=2762225 RepID=A0ABR8UUK4_9MICC|nr:hypothetical protein [Arthrobacter gallicola]MBD7996208.1 hypothetical protein [Arthrobacter gallicola]
MTEYPTPQETTRAVRYSFGMPLLLMAGLALLGLPRAVLHDLQVIHEGAPVTWFLALAPVAVWILVTVRVRSPRPFLTVLVIGVMFGVMLAITHQLLWNFAFAGMPALLEAGPALRLATVPGSLMTGAAIGAIGGLLALALTSLRRHNGGHD